MAGPKLWSEEKKKEEEEGSKEEKTQAQMLKEDLFPELYGELNLSQFVNPDQTVRIDELGKHLGKLGFSAEPRGGRRMF